MLAALAMQMDKHTVGYLTYHGGIRSLISTSIVRDTGNITNFLRCFLNFKVSFTLQKMQITI